MYLATRTDTTAEERPMTAHTAIRSPSRAPAGRHVLRLCRWACRRANSTSAASAMQTVGSGHYYDTRQGAEWRSYFHASEQRNSFRAIRRMRCAARVFRQPPPADNISGSRCHDFILKPIILLAADTKSAMQPAAYQSRALSAVERCLVSVGTIYVARQPFAFTFFRGVECRPRKRSKEMTPRHGPERHD